MPERNHPQEMADAYWKFLQDNSLASSTNLSLAFSAGARFGAALFAAVQIEERAKLEGIDRDAAAP